MGSATNNGEYNPGLTDVLMLVSVNLDTERVAVLSIPRDYYAFVARIQHAENQSGLLLRHHERFRWHRHLDAND